MSDARLLEWLEKTRAVVDAPAAERAGSLDVLVGRRDELARSLAESPPVAFPESLARELEGAEAALQTLLAKLGDALRDHLGELRRVQAAAGEYRPARANRPAFVSRSI